MAAAKTRFHFAEQYLVNPQHRVTVDLVGLGGTGCRVLSDLADINIMLAGLDHPGLYVRAWDPDVVTEFNIGRQSFSRAEVGQFKSVSLITKINTHYGFDWEARPSRYTWTKADEATGFRKRSNILITCVDTIAARYEIGELVASAVAGRRQHEPPAQPYYWLDYGNAQRTGQVVLGTLRPIQQPKPVPDDVEAVSELRTVLQLFPQLKRQSEDESGPSCSLAEALSKQDLFINRTLAGLGMQILWNLLTGIKIQAHGIFLNLGTLTSNPINI